MMRLSDVARWAGGELRGADAALTGVGIDSRTLRTGELFAALPGTHRDGHDYVAAACARRAAGALVARWQEADCPQVRVAEPLQALQRIAQEHRRRLPVRLAAVTGSNGKTTAKEMAAALLGAQAPCMASPGNWNNHLGVPLTLLRIAPVHRYAVVEMGASGAGEIAAMAAWAAPQAAAITCAAEAHLDGFGDLDGVARAKGELFDALPADGTAVINADDAYAPLWRDIAGRRRVIEFSTAPSAQAVVARLADGAIEFTWRGARARLPWAAPGLHNARNAACAVALGLALELPFPVAAQALAGFRNPACGRLRIGRGPNGAQLIDDSYNANPSSFRAAIDVLAARAKRRWLVMGEMRELGARADACHEEVARYAREAGVERLFALGARAERCAAAFGAGAQVCTGVEELAALLRRELRPDCAVLVKGSRAAALERLVDLLWTREAAHAA